ncbi:MAG: hypothetical protein JRI23_35100, partial [Deltaproteobacteria bacterium]|nr:hypothetical protein [Deltaproteobacteria bacterium]MBW2537541.1 hypothetical protein [Deltaproteobacteria bacterium]
CDNCPTYANTLQLGAEQDGYLGDACEAPWDENLLDLVSLFDPFTSSGGWIPVTEAAWTSQTDQITGDIQTYGDINWNDTSHGDGAYSVETVFVLDAGTGYSGEGYSGVTFAGRDVAGTMHWWACLYERDSKNLSVWEYAGGSNIDFITEAQDVDTVDVNTVIWRRVRVYFDGDDGLVCTFDNENGESDSVTVDTWDVGFDMGDFGGLRVYNETAHFRSFVIYI